jgi:hypothetical protein
MQQPKKAQRIKLPTRQLAKTFPLLIKAL